MATQNVLPTNHWVPDEDAPFCQAALCGQPFWFYCRRHHCRRCGLVFCSQHCAQWCPLRSASADFALEHPNSEDVVLARVCDGCASTYALRLMQNNPTACAPVLLNKNYQHNDSMLFQHPVSDPQNRPATLVFKLPQVIPQEVFFQVLVFLPVRDLFSVYYTSRATLTFAKRHALLQLLQPKEPWVLVSYPEGTQPVQRTIIRALNYCNSATSSAICLVAACGFAVLVLPTIGMMGMVCGAIYYTRNENNRRRRILDQILTLVLYLSLFALPMSTPMAAGTLLFFSFPRFCTGLLMLDLPPRLLRRYLTEQLKGVPYDMHPIQGHAGFIASVPPRWEHAPMLSICSAPRLQEAPEGTVLECAKDESYVLVFPSECNP